MKPGMTSAGGPSSGPRGPKWPKPRQNARQMRRGFVDPLQAPRRAVVGVDCLDSEELASHQRLQRRRQPHPPVLGLVVLEQRHEDARARQRGIVERVGEAHLAVARRGSEGWPAAPASRASVEQLCVSRYFSRLGTQLSISFMRYLPSPMSPVEVSTTW